MCGCTEDTGMASDGFEGYDPTSASGQYESEGHGCTRLGVVAEALDDVGSLGLAEVRLATEAKCTASSEGARSGDADTDGSVVDLASRAGSAAADSVNAGGELVGSIADAVNTVSRGEVNIGSDHVVEEGDEVGVERQVCGCSQADKRLGLDVYRQIDEADVEADASTDADVGSGSDGASDLGESGNIDDGVHRLPERDNSKGSGGDAVLVNRRAGLWANQGLDVEVDGAYGELEHLSFGQVAGLDVVGAGADEREGGEGSDGGGSEEAHVRRDGFVLFS